MVALALVGAFEFGEKVPTLTHLFGPGVAEIILRTQSKLSLKCIAAKAVKKYRLSYKGKKAKWYKSSLLTLTETGFRSSTRSPWSFHWATRTWKHFTLMEAFLPAHHPRPKNLAFVGFPLIWSFIDRTVPSFHGRLPDTVTDITGSATVLGILEHVTCIFKSSRRWYLLPPAAHLVVGPCFSPSRWHCGFCKWNEICTGTVNRLTFNFL